MPNGPRNLVIAFGAETLTPTVASTCLHQFLSRMGFKNAMAMDVRMLQRNHRYRVGEMQLTLLYPMILELERIETNQLLRQNGESGIARSCTPIRIRARFAIPASGPGEAD